MHTSKPKHLILIVIVVFAAVTLGACQDPPAPPPPEAAQEVAAPAPEVIPAEDKTWSPKALATQWTHLSRLPLPMDKRNLLSQTMEERWAGKKITWTAKVNMERCDRKARSCFVDPFKRTHLHAKEITSLRGFRPKLFLDGASWVKLVRACKNPNYCVATFVATVETVVARIDSPLVFILQRGHIHEIRPQPQEEFWLYDTKNTWSHATP